jgi:hypothetical protein
MGDSQNWSSFEPEAPKRPSAVSEEAEKSQDKHGKGLSALTEPMALRNMRNRLIFGSLVGFVTGATFGGSTWLCRGEYSGDGGGY